jgi:V8-like Glu-specific endopeptidase
MSLYDGIGGYRMRRKTGIVLGATTALVLVGAAGAAAMNHSDGAGRQVGSWHDAPAAARTPVAEVAKAPGVTGGSPAEPSVAARREAGPQETRPQGTGRRGTGPRGTGPRADALTPSASGSGSDRQVLPESAQVAGADGRQKVGELLPVNRLLDYLAGGARTEKFAYPGASYVKLHFNRMAMLPGDYLTVSNPSGTESYRYDAPGPVGGGSGDLDKWAMSITGDTAVLEMHRAAGDALGLGNLLGTMGVNVDRVAKGFTRTQQDAQPEAQLEAPGRTGKEESVCGADTTKDAVCYKSSDPVAYTKSKAVARLLINGTELCTSWRVGPKDRMLTNNHCLTTTSDARDTEVWFNYQCAQCGGYDVFEPTKVWGDQVLSTDHTYDYTLFSVDSFSAVQKFGFLSLDTARPVKGQELYVPQHPAGEPTRIAGALGDKAGNCIVADNDYTGYANGSDVSYYCDTEGGSSGSPVISRKTGKVVALHHFGGCPNSGVRADLLAAKLRSLL